MPTWAAQAMDTLWGNALTAVPLALMVAAACRWLPCRPWTRHTLWLLVLGWLIIPPLLPRAQELTRAMSATSAAAPAISSAIVHGRSDADASDPASGAMAIRLAPPDANENREELSHSKAVDERGIEIRSQRSEVREPRLAANFTPLSESGADFRLADEMLASAGEAAARDTTEPDDSWHGLPAHKAADGSGFATEIASQPVAVESKNVAPPAAELHSSIPPIQPAAPPMPTARAEWRVWLAGIVAVRDAVLALSPIPPFVWLGGLAFVLLVRLLAIGAFCRRLRAAFPASAGTVKMVREVASALKLKEAPDVAMVPQSISPLVWCPPVPGKNQLILPAGLWRELDELGRRAVLFHELAHLRRRDHWVCWLQLVVGSIFWWHPLCWWVNRRLREEADFCCDAWVTWLLPRGRRAYAEALVRARAQSSESLIPVPAVGMGVNHPRTQRFARRITMVMTESKRPRLSLTGIVLAAAVAAAGWAAAPARSCPPKETTPSCKKAAKPAKAPKAPKAAVAPAPPEAPLPPEPPAPPEADDENTFEEHMHKRAPRAGMLAPLPSLARGLVFGAMPSTAPLLAIAGSDEDEKAKGEKGSDIEKRLERLERQLERMAKRLDEMSERPGTPRPDRPERPERPETPAPPGAPRAAPPQPPMPGRTPGDVASRSYSLPSGKLEALAKLMSRDDVPIRVRPSGDGIEVQATEDQHEAFKGFVDLLEGKTEVRAYRLPKGKLEDLAELMVRSDVPILVEPSEGEIRVHATPSQHEAFEAFVDLLDGSRARRRTPGSAAGRSPEAMHEVESHLKAALERGRAGHVDQAEHLAKAEVLAHMLKEHEVAKHEHIRALNQAMRHKVRELQTKAKQLGRQAEMLDRQADELSEKADRLREQADELRERADGLNEEDEGEKLRIQATQLEDQARAIEEESTVVREQSVALEAEADAFETEAEITMENAEAEAEAAEAEAEAAAEEAEAAAEAELPAAK